MLKPVKKAPVRAHGRAGAPGQLKKATGISALRTAAANRSSHAVPVAPRGRVPLPFAKAAPATGPAIKASGKPTPRGIPASRIPPAIGASGRPSARPLAPCK